MPMIETDRLSFRNFTPDDFDSLFEIFSDPDVVRFLGTGATPSREEAQAVLNSYFAHWQRRGYGRFALIYKESGRLIGYCGLRWRSDQNQPEIVYLLAKEFWGRGLATEAARACLEYGFHNLNFQQIIAVTSIANIASQRVMNKLGMRYEREERLDEMDTVVYSISRNEFQSGSFEYKDQTRGIR